MNAKNDPSMSAERELLITHLFKAPRALVFKAWSTPEHLAHWSGPHGFTTPHHSMDFRPGGAFRACLRAPDGSDHWVQGVYRDIVEPERLVFTHSWGDANGNSASPETVVTITFEDQNGQTLMTFHQGSFDSVQSRDGHRGGWSESIDRLDTYLQQVAK